MSVYFGNGYFLNIVQRGAAPIRTAHSSPAQAPIRVEETVTTSAIPAETSRQELAVDQQPLAPPVPVSTTQPLRHDPLTESRDAESPLSESREAEKILLGTIPSQIPEAHDTPAHEASEPLRATTPVEPLSPASIQIGASLSTEPSVQSGAENSFTPVMNEQSRPASRVFELRMPEDFFGQTKIETSNNDLAKPSLQTPIVSAVVNPQTRSEDKTVQFSEPSVAAAIHADAQQQLESVIIPERTNELTQLQTIELSQSVPIAEPVVTAQPTNVVTELSLPPSRLIAAPVLETPVPPRTLEQTANSRQPGGMSFAPPAPPPRLRINRVDIQVINQAAPPPPPAHVPDASQLLERKHLGRVELLL